MDLFNLISAPNPAKVKTGTRPRAAHEVPLLTATANRVIDMEDTTGASGSSGTSSTVEKSQLDFAYEDPSPSITKRVGTEDQVLVEVSDEVPPVENPPTTEVAPEPDLEKETTVMRPLINKRRRKRGNDEADANAPPKVLRKDHIAFRPVQSTLGGKSLAAMGIEAGSTVTPTTQDTPAGASGVKDLDPLSYAKPRPIPEQDIAQSSKKTVVAEDPDSEKSTSFTTMGGSPGSIYQPGTVREAKLLKKAVAQVARRDQRIEAREKHIKNLKALLEAEADIKKAAEAKNAELAQVTCKERIKAAFEEFKKYKDNRVSSWCTEIDARLDALSIDFDEELYPHMLTAIADCRWVIRNGLRLAVMKCAESTELRQVFADVVSAGIAKGMSEGLKHGIEHGKANLDLTAIETYDPEAETKYVAVFQALKDLKYPLVDQLEKLKDALIDLIMASLHLENPWSFKEEILLEDAIAANISRAKKKKKCQVVCRTYRVGSAHHARFNGVPVLLPTVPPQGLAILLADAATQTDISEDKASPRLLRSKSLPPMYNLDWP
ncbi:hypothetical protein Tco_0320615 [Tanacetum coccineum]